jgi:iron(III)-enterobactin esterase
MQQALAHDKIAATRFGHQERCSKPKFCFNERMRRFAVLICAFVMFVFVSCATTHSVSSEGDGNFIIGPNYSPAPELTPHANVPRGAIHEFTMESTESKIYPGLTGPYHRKVFVYVPAQYKPGKAAPFIIIQDGHNYLKWMPTILDNMIADHRLPAMVAVMINSGGGDGKGSERGLEYDTLSDRYARFIETEVLPRISRDYNIRFTHDPDGRATMGGSSGAAAAFTMGWYRPDLYHRILTYSGTFVAQQSPEDPKTPHGAWEYHEHLIPQNPRKPLRVWLQVGDHDIGYDRDEASYHNWVMANDRMAVVLRAKSYHYHYDFCKGATHVDRKVLGQTLPAALAWVWRGYPVE